MGFLQCLLIFQLVLLQPKRLDGLKEPHANWKLIKPHFDEDAIGPGVFKHVIVDAVFTLRGE